MNGLAPGYVKQFFVMPLAHGMIISLEDGAGAWGRPFEFACHAAEGLSMGLIMGIGMGKIFLKVKQDELQALRLAKQELGLTWLEALKRGLAVKSKNPSRLEVQSMIDASIESARRGY